MCWHDGHEDSIAYLIIECIDEIRALQVVAGIFSSGFNREPLCEGIAICKEPVIAFDNLRKVCFRGVH